MFYQLTRKEGEVKEEGGEESKVNGVEEVAAASFAGQPRTGLV